MHFTRDQRRKRPSNVDITIKYKSASLTLRPGDSVVEGVKVDIRLLVAVHLLLFMMGMGGQLSCYLSSKEYQDVKTADPIC